ncbi:hypothetical protein L829_3527 [Mycobacteroides abscessus MAB_030201_1075]|uniref:Uncharacterized protein n=1 Tax=Mycobacteroides abscessus MAB_030201_1075 TaxID=1335410 RepID=A0A829PRW3_9MYCO|nr:hypothetical protein L835_0628 [Mycobacteroides abscessus MAB_110811_1470]ETZ89949.1 hypothetical protein L829_3527 [Mycobacteroides abscessus MAB_030201_1075]ETZ95743.1 hypothetical protein L828_0650 [Mycobacteroides abscessus MAB_030201_1061]
MRNATAKAMTWWGSSKTRLVGSAIDEFDEIETKLTHLRNPRPA